MLSGVGGHIDRARPTLASSVRAMFDDHQLMSLLWMVESDLARVSDVDQDLLVRFVGDALLFAALEPVRSGPLGGRVVRVLSRAGLVGLLEAVVDALSGGRLPDEVHRIGYDPNEVPLRRFARLGLLNVDPEVAADVLVDGGLFETALDGVWLLEAMFASVDVSAGLSLRGEVGAVMAAVLTRVPTVGGLVALGRAVVRRVQDGAGEGTVAVAHLELDSIESTAMAVLARDWPGHAGGAGGDAGLDAAVG